MAPPHWNFGSKPFWHCGFLGGGETFALWNCLFLGELFNHSGHQPTTKRSVHPGRKVMCDSAYLPWRLGKEKYPFWRQWMGCCPGCGCSNELINFTRTKWNFSLTNLCDWWRAKWCVRGEMGFGAPLISSNETWELNQIEDMHRNNGLPLWEAMYTDNST